MSEPTPPAAPSAAPPVPKPPAPPPRPLPSEDDVARWAQGEEVPLLGALFAILDLAKFDLLVTQIRKRGAAASALATARPSRGAGGRSSRCCRRSNLRVHYRDHELARRRVDALRAGWRALRGKRPGLWEAADFYAAYRRLLQQRESVAAYDLLTALRDVGARRALPAARAIGHPDAVPGAGRRVTKSKRPKKTEAGRLARWSKLEMRRNAQAGPSGVLQPACARSSCAPGSPCACA
jgi:hypothetical protein